MLIKMQLIQKQILALYLIETVNFNKISFVLQKQPFYLIQQSMSKPSFDDDHNDQIIQAQPQTVLPPISQYQQHSQQTPRSVLNHLEDVPIGRQLKPDALEHDMKLGWVPRSQITGPIPLSFCQQNFDWIIEEKQKTLIYLGFRPATTFQAHQQFYGEGKNYPFYQFHLCKAKFLQRFFKKYYSDYSFEGREPRQINCQSQLQFDSHYEGGNLDAVYFQQNQYCLLLRVDSNTLGHCNYYNFKVKPSKVGKFTFRIVNISKMKSLYQRGLRPYVKKIKPGFHYDFEQNCQNVRFGNSPLVEQYELPRMKSLKFQYEFDQVGVYYQFCYSIPYTYSELYWQIREEKSQCMHVSKLCHSLSGVQIPLLTITAPQNQAINDPFVIVVTGRVHPSEATGSHIVNGLIKGLISETPQAKWLRSKAIFKVIPMLNPDGVILGNTRTGVAGKDLNRKYMKNGEFVFPEINGIIDYVAKLKEKYGKKLLFLVDIHGHSTRKNSFFYGPQFSIMEEQYTRCRLLPKLYAARTEMFRYYSCKFKVASCKETTARGYFNSNGLLAYTHETSAHCYFDFTSRKEKSFTRTSLQELGKSLFYSMHDYIHLLYGKEVPLLPEPEKKLSPKRDLPVSDRKQEQEQDQESDKMSSNKDDSEDDFEDFQQRQLSHFFNQINENRQYFYEQLIKQKDSPQKNQKKQEKRHKKVQSGDIKYHQQKLHEQVRLQEQLLIAKRNSEKRIDWAAKAVYPQKKKQLQQYPKLSSVILGSIATEQYYQREEYSESSQFKKQPSYDIAAFLNTKYSINNIQAQFTSTQSRFRQSEFKITKNIKSFKRQRSLKDFVQHQSGSPTKKFAMDKKTKERYLQLKEQILPNKISVFKYTAATTTADQDALDKKLHQQKVIRSVPVCSVDIGQLIKQKKEEEKQLMKMTTSLKNLTRKKSIKNFRESQYIQTRKISKSIKASTLTKRLPSIGSLLTNH